jgi:hypothetical protein
MNSLQTGNNASYNFGSRTDILQTVGSPREIQLLSNIFTKDFHPRKHYF